MASPSLALLSVFIAGRHRPTRLLVQEGSPAFVTNIGRLVGGVPETAPLEDSEELRISLRGLAPGAAGVWGVATHRRDALVSSEWFQAFESRGIPTVELCLGGLFQLARRGPTAATLTIVSLDDEPAFEGAQLTALLTNDRALLERVRQLCLVDVGTEDGILDAAPRGLAEDERALQTVIEDAIAREEAAWTAARSGAAKTSGISLAWKRVFHSESQEAVPEKARPNPVPPPRGKNPWLARLAEAEQQHRQALDEANAALESLQAHGFEQAAQAQATIEEWKRRFEGAESEAAERAGRQAEALEETQRRTEELTKDLAAREERVTRLTAEWEASAARSDNQAAVSQRENAALQAALALANNRRDGLAQKLEKVEEQYEAAVIEAREREEALRSQSRAEVLALEALLEAARENASSSARLAENHAETLARLEARISAIDEDRDQVRNRLKSALAEREREASRHAALLAEGENARLALVSRTQELEESRGEALTRIARLEEQAAQMTMLSVAVVAERDATASRLLQAEGAHREALRLADEHAAVAERERAEETSRLHGLVLEWQARFDAAALASMEGAKLLETGHRALVARFQDEVSQLRNQAESSAQVQARETASAAERISLLEREKVTLETEREQVLSRLRQVEETSEETLRAAEQRTALVEREKSEQISRLNSLVTEGQARFDDALKAAAREKARLEAHQSEMVARLQDELAGLRRQAEAAALSHTRSETFLAQRLSEVEQEKSAASAERDELALRLSQMERDKAEEVSRLRALVAAGEARFDAAVAQAAGEAQRMEAELAARLRLADETHAQAQQTSEKRVVALEREKAEEAARANKIVTAWQARFEVAAKAAARQSQQVQTRHAALVGRLQEKVSHLKEQADRAARDHVKEAASLSKQLSAMEREKTVLVGERGEAEARLRQAEERHHEAFRLAEERATDLRRETADEAARRLSAESAEWQSRFDAAAVVASLERQRAEAHHAAVVARLEEEVSRLREQGEVAAKGHEAEAAALQQRLSLLEREKVAAMAEGRQAQTRWSEREESYREALRAAEQRAAVSLIERNEERARLSEVAAERQSRLDAVAGIHAKEVEALEARMSLLEREKAAFLGEIHDARSRLDRQEEGHREALRAAEERAAAAQREKVEEAARLNSAVSEWKSRLDEAAKARALEFDRLETGHAVHMARLQEEVAELKRQTLAAGQRLSELEQEKAAFLGERNEVQIRMRELEKDHLEKVEEAAQLKAALTEWQSRFDAAKESHKGESAALGERVSLLEREKAAAVVESHDARSRLDRQEKGHREALRAAEERAAAAQREKVEEAARLNAAVSEWKSRFDEAAKARALEFDRLETGHALHMARLQEEVAELKRQTLAAGERLSDLEQEKAAFLGERNEVQIRVRELEKDHIEKVEEAAQLKAALTEWQSRFDAAREGHKGESAALGERLLLLERENAAAVSECHDLQTRLRQLDESNREAMRAAEQRAAALQLEKVEEATRLNAAVAEWRLRFDATVKTAAKESQRLEASHTALVARLQEEVDQLRIQGGAAAEGHGKEAAAMMERLSGLENEKTKAIERGHELERRLSQMEMEGTSLRATIVEWQSRFDAAAKAATRESVRLETRHGTEVKGLQEALTQFREKADAAATDHAREAAVLAERLSVFERETARVSGERADIESRLQQVEESHREAMQLAEARLAEADARLRSAEARLAAAAESVKVASDGASQASESLNAALEARVLESGAHSKAVGAWEAHRAGLEQRIAELERAGSEPEFVQPRSGDEASVSPAEEGSPEWDFERVFRRAPKAEKNTLQGWVQGVARRVRRR